MDGDGVADPYNPEDAIFAAARYLRVQGHLLQQRALLVHGSDAQVGAAQIHSNREGWHGWHFRTDLSYFWHFGQ